MIKKGTKENYSSNKTNISETSQELAYQQLLLEKRDSEQFLRTIAPNYMGVYVLNRKTDIFLVLIIFVRLYKIKEGITLLR